MRISVAICTWNRQELLRQTLEEMTKLTQPEGVEWDVLIVNNNCTDQTDDVIASFATRLPIRRLFQPVPGLSNARNLVAVEFEGDYVIWTDDDVLVASDWLEKYVEAFRRWPEAAVFGGPIVPWFPNTPPKWLADGWQLVANAYASIDYGVEALPLTMRRVPFGANMAMRRDCLRQYPYDPYLGVRPGSRVGGEETDVVRRALTAGSTGWWVPTAKVRHYIPPNRQTLEYLRGWFYAYGMYLGRVDHNDGKRNFLGRPRWLWKQAVMAECRYQIGRHTQPVTTWMESLIRASVSRGQLRSFRHGPAKK